MFSIASLSPPCVGEVNPVPYRMLYQQSISGCILDSPPGPCVLLTHRKKHLFSVLQLWDLLEEQGPSQLMLFFSFTSFPALTVTSLLFFLSSKIRLFLAYTCTAVGSFKVLSPILSHLCFKFKSTVNWIVFVSLTLEIGKECPKVNRLPVNINCGP